MSYKHTQERASWLRDVALRDEAERARLQELRAELRPKAPYPEFCCQPEKCIPAGRCTREWVCND